MQSELEETVEQNRATQFMSSDIPQRVCFPAVGTAYRLVVDLLQETMESE